MVLPVEMKPYLRGFYKFLKGWVIIEVTASRTTFWLRIQDAKCDITTGIWGKPMDESNLISKNSIDIFDKIKITTL